MNILRNKQSIEKSLLSFANQRGTEKTFCPSEVARDLFPKNWRNYMDDVRKVADILVKDKRIEVLQKDIIKADLPSDLKGPIRLRKPKV